MKMRLIQTSDHEFGRLNNSKKPTSVGLDCSDDVQKQIGQAPQLC